MPSLGVSAQDQSGRRGAAVFDMLSQSMDRLRKAGVIFGISVTYTRENAEIVSREEFLRRYIDAGAIFGWYFMFMPVGKDPILDLVPTPEQRLAFGRRIAEVRAFTHFGVDNIREKTILEGADSSFFQSIRKRFPYNQGGNLHGHEHSEDIIRDPRVVEWVDRYAERFRELTDPGRARSE